MEIGLTSVVGYRAGLNQRISPAVAQKQDLVHTRTTLDSLLKQRVKPFIARPPLIKPQSHQNREAISTYIRHQNADLRQEYKMQIGIHFTV